MLLLFRNRGGGGGLPLPPDYNPATDDLWIAQPGYLYSDAAGTTLLSGAGNALAWRSLTGRLAQFLYGAVAWDGSTTITGITFSRIIMEATVPLLTLPFTVILVSKVTDTSIQNRPVTPPSLLIYTNANTFTPVAYIQANLSLPGGDVRIRGVIQLAVGPTGQPSVLRQNGLENSSVIAPTATDRGTRIGIGPLYGEASAFWLAPGRQFDAAQRAANEAAMATLCQVVLP